MTSTTKKWGKALFYYYYYLTDILVIFLLQHAPGVPKILVGNRCHLAFKRQVSEVDAEAYALKNNMTFFEVSPLCDFNVKESLAELSRVALKRNGMSFNWGHSKGELTLEAPSANMIVFNLFHEPFQGSTIALIRWPTGLFHPFQATNNKTIK